VVLNRADSNSGITSAQVESSLDIKIAARLPTDVKTVLKSVQRAEPFVSLLPNAEISQRVRELALSLVPLHAAEGSAGPARKPGFWTKASAQARD
jgi:Flp pilus assembly CpaE family ATPase